MLCLLATLGVACDARESSRLEPMPIGWTLLRPLPPPPPPPPPPARCPPEMVLIEGRFCVDRWEISLVDRETRRELSPYYPPQPGLAIQLRTEWDERRFAFGSAKARATPLPPLPPWGRTDDVEPVAVSLPDVVPNGYLSGVVARRVCASASKRLCTPEEWETACRGESKQPFPYGERYEPGVCNVFRATHPAAHLHDDVSSGHLDPRLNLVADREGPLLRKTGATPRCVSRWGNDGVSDMVGNLDEWVDDPKGEFRGGFFSRGTKDGCRSRVRAHGPSYLDYSLGTRCCGDAAPPSRSL